MASGADRRRIEPREPVTTEEAVAEARARLTPEQLEEVEEAVALAKSRPTLYRLIS